MKKIKFGTGEIRISCAVSDEKGIVGFNKDFNGHAVGDSEPAIYESVSEIEDGAECFLSFSNSKSLRVLIDDLIWIEKEMKNRGL